jgi:hypothetical protein
MLGNFTEVISKLEQQKAAIDKAIEVLREFDGDGPSVQAEPKKAVVKKAAKKRVMSEEGRQRIAEATRKRWAAVRRAAAKEAKKAA